MKIDVDEAKPRRKARREVLKDRDFTTKVHEPKAKAARHTRKKLQVQDLDDMYDVDEEFYE